ncbi:MAG: hypothetical protein KBS40_00380 [Bacteroidales bacterium]|nr:hypothetical protein [Bacteroidales bacterium]
MRKTIYIFFLLVNVAVLQAQMITQWGFYQQGKRLWQPDARLIDSITITTPEFTDLTFVVEQTDSSLIITPSDKEQTYMWQLTTTESLDGMAKYVGLEMLTPEMFWQAYIDAKMFVPSIDLEQGELELNFAERSIGYGQYTVVIAGCDAAGQRTGKFFTAKMRLPQRPGKHTLTNSSTEPEGDESWLLFWQSGKTIRPLPSYQMDSITLAVVPEPVNLTLDVTDVGKTTATISVEPSRKVAYYFDYVPAAAMAEYPDDEHFAKAYIDFLKTYYPDELGDMVSYEKDSYTFTEKEGLVSGTDYMAIAVAIHLDDTTYIPTLAKQAFTTLKNEYIEGLDFSFSYLSADNKVQITPTMPEETYVWCMWQETEIQAKYGGSVEKAWQTDAPDSAGLGYVDTGVSYVNLTWECWMPGVYYIGVAGYKNGQTSPVAVYRIDYQY